MSKLFVANFPFSLTSDELRDLFTPYGTVHSAEVAMDRETGRAKGYGFVAMGSVAEAQAAKSGLAGQEIGGRQLRIDDARPREGGRPSGGGGYRDRDDRGPRRERREPRW